MRRYAAVVALLVVLAGCSTGYAGSTPDATTSDADTPHATASAPPDPDADRLGWESGYWANETLTLDRSDGLNESERDAVVSRAMARVEQVRRMEFEERVPVELLSREEFRENRGEREYERAFRQFDNAKFEALFLIGEETDSLATQQSNRGSSVAGFYSPSQDRIVVIYPGDTPDLPGEGTLSHELVHALQDQQFDLGSITASTRDGYNANNGLIEGDANFVQTRYMANCGEAWACLSAPASGGGGGGGDFHVGVYALNFFPYSDGPGFIEYYHQQGGWDRVNAMFDDPPASSEQVIHPRKYAVEPDPPTDVRLDDATANGWERVRPSGRAASDTVGQSAIAAMFAYTLYDDHNEESVVAPEEFLNRDGEQLNRSDPFDYALDYADGWDGDRLHVYAKNGETAYVWKTTWDSPSEAREFAAGYRELLRHWGGERVRSGVYRVADGPFADSFRVTVEGDTVTVVNAPTTRALGNVRR